ncbi:hypothetical protein ABQZ69_03700 [Xanthomonas sp. WHRI 8391]|uniref:hypothetical protein n=1 Tax=Xanthomonas TaxID=338 RepID=UPI001A1A1036|nr:hypothetical protein [Xanthomonas hortorum]MBG3850076.1 hypothetical protein [Xanthomonas hortorum pv. carotae]UTS72704.1 hypothetical protein NMB96_20080 [Xanthomonas hortorum]
MSGRKPQWFGECPGVQSQIEFALRFTQWMQARRQKATASEMMDRWGMSRATAYRYKAAYRAVKGGDA